MYDLRSRDLPLVEKMDKIRRRRGAKPETEEARKKRLALLNSCHQPDGGPCRYVTAAGSEDKRCGLSGRTIVQCPYLGDVEPLRETLEEQEEEKKNLELIYEPPPDLDL